MLSFLEFQRIYQREEECRKKRGGKEATAQAVIEIKGILAWK